MKMAAKIDLNLENMLYWSHFRLFQIYFSRIRYQHSQSGIQNEPCHEIMALSILHKRVLQTRMCSHPVGLDVWFLVGPFIDIHFMCATSEGSGKIAQMRRLVWAFASHLCDKYHNLIRWLKCSLSILCNLIKLILKCIQFCSVEQILGLLQ